MARFAATLLLFVAVLASGPAAATSGWGCFRVVNVESWDALNMRFGPSAAAAIVGTIAP